MKGVEKDRFLKIKYTRTNQKTIQLDTYKKRVKTEEYKGRNDTLSLFAYLLLLEKSSLLRIPKINLKK